MAKTPKVQIAVYVPVNLLEEINERAEAQGKTRTVWMVEAAREKMATEDQKELREKRKSDGLQENFSGKKE